MRKMQIAAVMAAVVIFLPQGLWAQENRSETYRQLKLFGDVFERVRADYVDEVTDQELIEAALQGMLSALDPPSRSLNAAPLRHMRTHNPHAPFPVYL